MVTKPEGTTNWIVLIVDDNYDNVMVAQAALVYHGAEVHIANNGEEGLELLNTVDPTVILLDLAMPVMDGWQMLEKLRALPKLEKVPIIAVTAHAMESDRARVMEAGFDEFIAKPYDVKTLASRIGTVVERKLKG